jgi:hypothetical protein
MFRTIGFIVALFLVIGVTKVEAESPFALLSKGSALSSGQFTVTQSLPQAELLGELINGSTEHATSDSEKLTYKNVLVGNIAPFVGSAMKNLKVSIPSNFVAYDYGEDSFGEQTIFVATEDDHVVYDEMYDDSFDIGGFEISLSESDWTVNKKGDFALEGTALSVKELQKVGFTNIKLEKGLFRGMKGYYVVNAVALWDEEVNRGLYIYDAESESVVTIFFRGGEDEKRNAEIWKNFTKSVFAKVKVVKGSVIEPEPYENSLYTINAPTGWTTCECESPYELYLMDSVSYNFSSGSFTPNIYVSGELSGETSADLQAYKDVAEEIFEEEGGTLTSAKITKTKNGQAVIIQGNLDTDGLPTVGKQLVVIKGGVTYILTAIVPKTKWKEYEKAITASLLSFKIK